MSHQKRTFICIAHFQGRGLDDDRIKYYPFRDDAKIVLKEFKVFVNKIVDTYYNQGFWFRRRSQIQNDKELQSWVNELSIDGAEKPNGGKGKVRILFVNFKSNPMPLIGGF